MVGAGVGGLVEAGWKGRWILRLLGKALMLAELWWRVEGTGREWPRGREELLQSGEARVRYRALEELRGEAVVRGGGQAAWG